MTEIDLVRDTTMQDIARSLQIMAGRGAINHKDLTYAQLKEIVNSGKEREYLNIGDQIMVKWTNNQNDTTYDVPLDIVDFGTYTDKRGNETTGIDLVWHFTTPMGVQFSQRQAMYYAPDGLTAGTYYVTWGQNYGNVVQGDSVNFTLTQDLPAGGQLRFVIRSNNPGLDSFRITTHASNATKDILETLTLSDGAVGTSLGTTSQTTSDNENLNCMQRFMYGNANYRDSAVRQYINSSGADWWKPQTKFDAPPDQSTLQGFMTGFEQDFLDILSPTYITTGYNKTNEASLGVSYETLDTFFLPSCDELFWGTMHPVGTEGKAWQYYKDYRGSDTRWPLWQTFPELRMYDIANQSAPQHVWRRSCHVSHANNAVFLSSSGNLGSGYACSTGRLAPACRIIRDIK